MLCFSAAFTFASPCIPCNPCTVIIRSRPCRQRRRQQYARCCLDTPSAPSSSLSRYAKKKEEDMNSQYDADFATGDAGDLDSLLEKVEQGVDMNLELSKSEAERNAGTDPLEDQMSGLKSMLKNIEPGERWERKKLETLMEDLRLLSKGGGEAVEKAGKEEIDEIMRLGGFDDGERSNVERLFDSEEKSLGESLEKEGSSGKGDDIVDATWRRLSGLANLERIRSRTGGAKSLKINAEDARRAKELMKKRRKEIGKVLPKDVDNIEKAYQNVVEDLAKRPKCPGCGEVRTYENNGVVELCPTCKANEILTPLTKPGGVVYEPGTAQARKAAAEEEVAAVETTSKAVRIAEQFTQERAAAYQDLLASRQQAVSSASEPETIAKTPGVDSVSPPLENQSYRGDGLTSGANGHGDGSGGIEHSTQSRRKEWHVPASDRSLRTINPIRNLVQGIKVLANPEKKRIDLSVGDPTRYGNLRVDPSVVEEFRQVIGDGQSNGYSTSFGAESAREAVAKKYSLPSSPLAADDVVLTSGTSGALEIALGCIANSGDNILLPRPGFPLFRTVAEYFGIECRYYSLLPDRNWEINLADLGKLTDDRTAALVVNSPSNPCGCVYSKDHLRDLVAVASSLFIPIIADEVYADMVFSETSFTPIASLSTDVPILSVGSISKQFVVPGWRLGWILIHDRNKIFARGGIRKGIRQLTTRMLVPNTPTQAVLPKMLGQRYNNSNSGFIKLMKELEANAKFTVENLDKVQGITCVKPQGSMYLMARINVGLLGLKDDMEFTEKLLEEEAVFVLPGRCFMADNFVRIVFCAPQPTLNEAFHRIRAFCARRTGGM